VNEELRFERAMQGYRNYCWLNVTLYSILFLSGLGVALLPSPGDVASADPGLADSDLMYAIDPAVMRTLGIGVAIAATILVVLALLAMKRSRSETSYALHLANIAAGISSCVLTPFCAWLMKEWTRAEFKTRFLGNPQELKAQDSSNEGGASDPTFKL
jgi:hypothetical protein